MSRKRPPSDRVKLLSVENREIDPQDFSIIKMMSFYFRADLLSKPFIKGSHCFAMPFYCPHWNTGHSPVNRNGLRPFSPRRVAGKEGLPFRSQRVIREPYVKGLSRHILAGMKVSVRTCDCVFRLRYSMIPLTTAPLPDTVKAGEADS